MKKTHCLYLLSILLFASNPTLVGAPRLAFERTWGGPNIDRGSGIAIAPDGGVYVAGLTGSFGTGAADGDWDVVLLKYDAAGTLLWQRTWGRDQLSGSRQALDDDYALDLALGPDGSVHLGGVYSGGGGPLVLKLDPDGNVIWATTWQHPTGFGHAQSITVAGDGSVYVVGGINGAGAGFSDMLIIKFASDGSLLWQQTWGGSINEIARDVAAAPDGGVYVAGEGNSFFANDAILLRYAPDGTLVWQRDWHEGTIQDLTCGEGVAVGPDGSVFLAGFAGITGVGQHIFLVKFTSDGSVVWESTSGGAAESGLDVALGPNGNIYVAGSTLVADTSDTLVTEFLPEGKIRSSVT
ncbi:MAG: PQQ-binding-like beta-propeller repeat protein [Verrucomicrobiales bacterium]|nr:PQQ-binding-like beta-propeller repeat protein [Verrucomicrobiales bacterium]